MDSPTTQDPAPTVLAPSHLSERPIFIVGMPRSGTTLLRSILTSHSGIAIPPETHYFNHWLKEYQHLDLLGRSEDFEAFWQTFTESERFSYFGVEPAALAHRMEHQGLLGFPGIFQALIEEYTAGKQKRRWGEKTPAHFQHLDTIFQWFPDAQILWLLRDPRATIASLLKVEWASSYAHVNAEQWQDSVDRYEKSWAQHPQVYLVRYEDLVQDPQAQIPKLCEFLQEPFEAQMLQERTERDMPVPFQSGWGFEHLRRAMQPADVTSLQKWRDQLSADQVSAIEAITRRSMLQYGYEPVTQDLSEVQSKKLAFSRRFHAFQRQFRQRLEALNLLPKPEARWVGDRKKRP